VRRPPVRADEEQQQMMKMMLCEMRLPVDLFALNRWAVAG